MEAVYESLRDHLDSLPGGFPPTEDGVELRILKRLFTPEEARLALHLTLKLEPAAAVARRAHMDEAATGQLLQKMSRKGLVFSIETPDRPPAYMATQFLVGIWEYHVNDLDEAFVKDLNEYMPVLAKEAIYPLPPLRTIPVGRSIQAGMEVLSYEQAEALVKEQEKFLVAPCICRKEHQLLGEGCDKLMDACLVFGWGADYYQRNGLGRVITLEETLDILKQAEEEGLVLQPSNSQEITNICCCCGDCCQILLNLKHHPAPVTVAYTPFVVQVDPEACIGCEICMDRCQMDALSVEDGQVVLDADRCIGCGLCVSTCSGEACPWSGNPRPGKPRSPKPQWRPMSCGPRQGPGPMPI
jgi:Pyruvate/2-oxoacid:ferredoxin oxidoreductase delta subunit